MPEHTAPLNKHESVPGPTVLARRDLLKASFGAAFFGLAACDGSDTPDGPVKDVTRPTGLGDESWADVRAHFMLEPGIAYLNNASLGMPPQQVVAAVHDGYRALSSEPLRGKHTLQARIADEVLPRLANFFGVNASEIVLTRNASEALHLQSIGLDLSAGDEVLITTQEHPAGRRPWLFRASREATQVREVFIPSPLPSPESVVTIVDEAVGPRTRAIAFCHVTRGGHVYPVRQLCEMASARGLVTLVDGAQAVGQMPIDLGHLGCDAYAASLHKWFLGPAGTGVLYVRELARHRIRTAFAHDASRDNPMFAPPGTVDFPVRAALLDALDFVERIGLDQIEARCRYLSDYLKDRLAESPGVSLLSGDVRQSAPGNTIFEVGGLDALDAVSLIAERVNAHIDEHQRDGHNAIRISTHVYNTTAELDRVVAALTA